MKTTMLRSLALLLMLSPLIVRATTPPANDKFAGATALSGQVVTLAQQSGAAATAEALDPYIGGIKPTHSVWYRFDSINRAISISNNHVIVNHLAGANIGLFELGDADGGAGSLYLVQQVTNAAAGTDTLTFETAFPQRYYVCVDTPGIFSITLQQPGQNNDFFADAQVITGSVGSTTGSNLNCTDTGDTPPDNFDAQNSVWYTWVAPATAAVVFNTNFSYLYLGRYHSTAMAVYTGGSLATLALVTSDYSSGTGDNYGSNSRVSFNATAGTTYHIRVGTYSGGEDGNFNLEWCPANSPGTFQIFPYPDMLGQNQGTATYQVLRSHAGNAAAAITVTTSNDSAIAGQDFTALNVPLSFPSAGASTNGSAYMQTFSVAILSHSSPQVTKTFDLNLSNGTPGATVVSPFTVTIVGEPATVAPGFETPTLTVKSTDGLIQIPISRGSDTGSVVIGIGSVPSNSLNTAVENVDYSLENTNLNFLPGQTSGSVGVNVTNTNRAVGNKTFTLSIATFPSGQTVNGFSSIAVTIQDVIAPQPAAGRLTTILDNLGTGIAGSVDLTISTTGAITGKLVMDKGVLPFTGRFDATGLLTVHFYSAGALTRTLTVQLLDSATQIYQVTLVDNVLGSQNSFNVTLATFSAANPCPAAGAYTFADTGGLGAPQYTAATLKVDALGNATLAGKVFDGTAYIASGAVDTANNANVAASLYAGQGRLTFQATLPTTAQTLGNGGVHLVRPGRANQNVELPAIDNFVDGHVAQYVPPAASTAALPIWNPAGTADLTGGGFGVLTSLPINVSTKNVVTIIGNNTLTKLALTLTPSTGVFTGTVIPTGAAKPVSIYGVLLQGGLNSEGLGFFLNGITPGHIHLY